MKELLKESNGNCYYCGLPLYDAVAIHIDHLIPKAKGGVDDKYNLVLTCNFCNMAKCDHELPTFLNWLKHIRLGSFECFAIKENRYNNLKIEELDALKKSFYTI